MSLTNLHFLAFYKVLSDVWPYDPHEDLVIEVKYYHPTLQTRKLRFLAIRDLGDSLEQERP